MPVGARPGVALAATLAVGGFGAMPQLVAADEGGSVALVAAVGITILIYSAAIALDLANIYLNKALDQRTADQSAIAAAFAYAATGSSATAQNAASSLAMANGVASASDVVTSIGPSPTGDGRLAAEVTVTTPVPLSGFGRIIAGTKANPAGSSSLPVGAFAFAEIHGSPPCILALQTGGGGVSMTGGTRVTATNCPVASNASVAVSNGPTLTATDIYAVGSISSTGGATINGPQYPDSSKQSDPYASAGVFARLATVASLASPSFAALPGIAGSGPSESCSGSLNLPGNALYGNVTDSYYNTCTINFSGGGTTSMLGLSLSGSSATINFGAGTYNIGSFAMSSYGTVTVNIASGTVINILGALTSSSSNCATFAGTAIWTIQGGISDSSSCTLSFSNTNSSSLSTFSVAGGITVSNGHAVFPAGTYTIATAGNACAGLCVSGGTSATFGNGSFVIADGISLGGGGTLTIGNQQSSSSVFQIPNFINGDEAISTSGGSTLSIGSFPNVDVNGPVQLEGNAYLGAGTWTVNGTLDMASSGGGTFSAPDNTFIASGPIAFGAGFNSITLDAPNAISTGTEGQVSTVALASNSTTASTVESGASDTVVTGAIYFPDAALTESGAGNLTGNGSCLQVIANAITLSGGSTLTTNCSNLGNGAPGSAVSLVE
jgi:hypothetical protein